jgi:hypothetical protein
MEVVLNEQSALFIPTDVTVLTFSENYLHLSSECVGNKTHFSDNVCIIRTFNRLSFINGFFHIQKSTGNVKKYN